MSNCYMVKRLEDGFVVPLTCTAEELPLWLENGYELVEDEIKAMPESIEVEKKSK